MRMIVAFCILLLGTRQAYSFQPSTTARRTLEGNGRKLSSSKAVVISGGNHAKKDINDDDRSSVDVATTCTRRNVITGAISLLVGSVVSTTASPDPAEATYSAYSRREEDWQSRVKAGEVQYSSAGSLRNQLRDIAPMNTENSRIFCPNGPSAAVSPLMENKCGDRLATPSVYGRYEDVLGNSIPGFQQYPTSASSSDRSAADTGGFPSYQFN